MPNKAKPILDFGHLEGGGEGAIQGARGREERLHIELYSYTTQLCCYTGMCYGYHALSSHNVLYIRLGRLYLCPCMHIIIGFLHKNSKVHQIDASNLNFSVQAIMDFPSDRKLYACST